MRTHIDLLGWFHVIWGLFGSLTGLSLAILAASVAIGLPDVASTHSGQRAVVWLCATAGAVLVLFGAGNIAVGYALLRRLPFARPAALGLSVPNLVIVPFGTALGVYAYWVLLNDDARRQFAPPGPRIAPAAPV